ncbi:MAG TPA: bifunctional hydroxymethylpyrimidine kinase/phosphomethylpyrimidine kinase [Thermodesulfobacteriota bacterium]|nr:bifunctional hydroxymethylpyrimidine kinase/phosphomethylpyrimidine kinase [Thermodesulfobacteriota bacterium]
MKKILTIGGSDPSGFAGIQADLLTFSKFGTRGLSAITAITAQTEKGVKATGPVSPVLVKKQVETLLEKFRIDAVKIGMLGTVENVGAVKKLIRKWKLKNIVLDPVMRSTGGYPLLDRKGVGSLKKLLRYVTVVTPNLSEAGIISGIKVKNIKEMEGAAKRIHRLGVKYVLIKGGHLRGAPVDVLYDGKRFIYFRTGRIKGPSERFHGTGCLLSSAIAAGLAMGKRIDIAVRDAKGYVRKTLQERRV